MSLPTPAPLSKVLSSKVACAGLCALVCLIVLGATPARVQATTFTVTKTADTNDGACNADCSLREAVIASNASGTGNIINLPAGTYTLTRVGSKEDAASTGDLDITNTVTIVGSNGNAAGDPTATIIDGNGATLGDKIFDVNPLSTTANFTIQALTIQNAINNNTGTSISDFSGYGAGIEFYGGNGTATTLTVNNCIIQNNSYGPNNTGAGINAKVGKVSPGIDVDDAATCNISNTIIRNNNSPSDSNGNVRGGGISYEGGQNATLTLTNCTISGNDAGDGISAEGGGLFLEQNTASTSGTVQIHGCLFSNNTAGGDGGGISVVSTQALAITIDAGTIITGNHVLGSNTTLGGGSNGNEQGGGLFLANANGTTALSKVEISNNDATTASSTVGANTKSGGGIYVSSGPLTISNSTLSGNTATNAGGGIEFVPSPSAALALTSVTDTNNTASTGGGINTNTNAVTLNDTIIYGNTGGDISGTINTTVSSSYNLTGANSGGLVNGTNHNLVGVNPLLSALANNGGTAAGAPTATQVIKTHALGGGSPALDAGDPTITAPGGSDQRGTGFQRVLTGPSGSSRIDIGAVEQQPALPAIPNQSFTTSANPSGSVTFTLGDATITSGIDSVTATSSNTTLLPNANISVTGSGSSRTVTYNPAAFRSGTTTITVTATDVYNGVSESSSTSFTLTINPAAPTANNQSVTTAQSTAKAITLTGSDPNNPALSLTYAISANPNHGMLSGFNASTGAVTYTPTAGYIGGDSFQFTVNNGTATSTAATVSISVVGKPTANNQSVSTSEGIAVSITLTGTDPNSPALPLTYTVTVGPAHGTLSGTAPNLTYTPNAGYVGADSFQFTATNGTATSSAATVSITVTGPPTANSQSVNVAENTAKAITLTGSDPNTPPRALTYTVTANPTHGTLSGFNASTGAVTYTPTAGYFGTDTFQFKVNNGALDSNTATVSITVVGTPTANSQSVNVISNTPTAITLTGSDPNTPPLALTYSVTTSPTHGTLSGTAPNLTYTPNNSYQGSDSFQFTVSNGTSTSSPATVSINVAPGTPTANNQAVTTNFQTAKNITLTATDPDSPALTLTYAISMNAAHGTLSGFDAATGAVTYTPNTGYQGPDSFQFTASNGTNTSSAATVSITVNPGTPTANPQSVNVPFNTATAITLTGSDPDLPPLALTYTVSSNPTHGTLSGTAPNLTYTPTANYQGTDSFQFTASNGTNTSAPATVSITVAAGKPTANNQTVTTAQDTAKAITLTGGDPDVPALALTYTVTTNPTQGTLSGTAPNLTYTPNAGYFGADTFQFTVNNGTTTSEPATVTINVVGKPTANSQSVSVISNTATPITLTGSDPNTPPLTLTYTVATSPSHGTLSGFNASTGAVTYTPNAGYQGTDSFTFTVSNGTATSNAATVSINVAPGTPTASNQTVNVAHDTAKAITLTGSDAEDSPPLALTYAISANPTHGTLSGFNASTGAVTYTPNANYQGSDSFQFTVSNGTHTSAPATVTLTVAPGTPTANPQSVTTSFNMATAITLTGTDPDNPALPLTYAIVGGQGPTHGSLSGFNANTGAITYTPTANYQGSDSFQFTVSNGPNTSAPATVSITVSAGTPTANNQSVTTAQDTAATITLTGSDPDSPPLALTYTVTVSPTHGTLSGTAPNLTYTPTAGYFGADSFQFTVSNGMAISAPATVSLNIVGQPSANSQSVSTNESTAKAITLTGSDPNDPALDLTYAISTNPTHGTLSGFNASTGVITYTPNAGYFGSDSFQFTVSNGTATSTPATISITVVGKPTANAQSVTTNQNVAALITLTGSDPNTPPLSLTYTVSSNPTHGTLSGTAPNLTYTPDSQYRGPDSFTFTVSNGPNTSDPATVSITVNRVNQAPTIDSVSTQTVLENVAQQTVNLTGITTGTSDTDQNITSVTATSNNTALIPNPTVTYTPNNTAGTLAYTPVANQYGSATITVTVTDDGGTANGGVNTVSETFTINVTRVNQVPTLDAISDPAAILEDTGAQTVNLSGITAGANDADQTLVVAATSNNTALIPDPTVTYTSPNTMGSLTYTPVANANGSATITVMVHDSGGTANGGTDTVTRTFTVNVTPVNDPPTINSIANQATDENSGAQTVTLTGISSGPVNESSQTVTISATSNNIGLVPNPTITYTDPDATGTLHYTPVANTFGTATITVTVQDNGGTTNGGNDTTTRQFVVTVARVNQAPTLDPIVNPPAILEDAGAQTVNLTGISAGSGDADQGITVTATSNNTNLIANPTVTYTSPNATGTLTYTPVANANGSAVITVKVQDDGGTSNGGVDTVTQTFTVNVTAVNDPPTLNALANQSPLENPGTQTVNLTGITAGPADESGQTITITATSSNPTLIPNPQIAYTSHNATGILTYTPTANNFGTATITVMVKDNGGTANGGIDTTTRTFTVTVTRVNQAPTLNAITNPGAILEDAGAQTINLAGITAGAGDADQGLTVTATSSNPALIPNPTVTYTSPNATGKLTYTPVADANGTATITVTVQDNGGTSNGGVDTVTQTFTVNVTAVNDAPVNLFNGGATFAAQTTSENTPIVFNAANANRLTVADVDAGTSPVQVTLAATNGTLSLGNTAGLNFTAGGNNSANMTFTGTLSSINAALNGLSFVPATNANGGANLTITTNDLGNTGSGGPLSATNTVPITITATARSLSINNVRATEGNTGTTPAVFTVTLSTPSAQPLTVQYATSDGTATAGSDYTATNGTLTFAPGVTTQTITVNILGDTTVEPDETFFVNLTNVIGGATLATTQGTGTIVNDDQIAPPPTVPVVSVQFSNVTNGSIYRYLPNILGTVSESSAPAGARLMVQVSIQRQSDKKFFNGASWSASPTFFPANLARGIWLLPAGVLPSGQYLVDDKYTLTAQASDGQGNSASQSITLAVDHTSPTISITTPKDATVIGQLNAIAGTSTDAKGGTGVQQVLLQLVRVSDGKYFDGTHFVTPLKVKGVIQAPALTTLLNKLSGVWSRRTGLPAKSELIPGAYRLLAIAIDGAGNRGQAISNFDVAGATGPLSAATANVASSSVTLRFLVALDAESAGDASQYAVTVNGHVVRVDSAGYNANNHTVILALADGSLRSGDAIIVRWHDLQDAAEQMLVGETETITAH